MRRATPTPLFVSLSLAPCGADAQEPRSTFHHDANSFAVPATGTSTLRAGLGVSVFHRHGEESETRPRTEGTTVELTDVELTRK